MNKLNGPLETLQLKPPDTVFHLNRKKTTVHTCSQEKLDVCFPKTLGSAWEGL